MEELKIRQYRREKYACHLEIGAKRLTADGQLREPSRVTASLTKVLARCVRDQAVITGAAHVKVGNDFLTNRWMLRAWAYAFQDVQPEHADTLRSFLDRRLQGQIVEIPE